MPQAIWDEKKAAWNAIPYARLLKKRQGRLLAKAAKEDYEAAIDAHIQAEEELESAQVR